MIELLNLKTNEIIKIPSQIEEFTPVQYLFYLKLNEQYCLQIIDKEKFKRKLFVNITGLRPSWKMMFYHSAKTAEIWESVQQKIDLFNCFFDENNCLKVKSVQNLLPEWNGFAGPKNMLQNLTWGDYTDILVLLKVFSQASAENKKSIGDNIFRTLYKGGSADVEIPYEVVAHAINFFITVNELITTTEISINGENVNFSILWEKNGDEVKVEDKSGWAGLTFMIAECAALGNDEQVKAKNLWDVLLYLYYQHVKLKREQKQYDKITQKSKK
ncbi:MAG: hypothetical protein LBB41_07365 [Prevotellaceae bacterium]|jgi:hypothetical protein|nr:hypothetical protein [Prevotellaceae bacterium]